MLGQQITTLPRPAAKPVPGSPKPFFSLRLASTRAISGFASQGRQRQLLAIDRGVAAGDQGSPRRKVFRSQIRLAPRAPANRCSGSTAAFRRSASSSSCRRPLREIRLKARPWSSCERPRPFDAEAYQQMIAGRAELPPSNSPPSPCRTTELARIGVCSSVQARSRSGDSRCANAATYDVLVIQFYVRVFSEPDNRALDLKALADGEIFSMMSFRPTSRTH
jgi:hypothetical protein